MKHITEEALIAYREGERKGREGVAAHLQECSACQQELERIEAVYRALDAMPVPDPGPEYGRRVWTQIASRLPEESPKWWQQWWAPRRVMAFGAMAALLVLAFLLGRSTRRASSGPEVINAGRVRERVLLVAVGDHLGRSEMVLVELANAQPVENRDRLIDFSAEQKRAEDLLEENRLYRQTALKEGNTAMASTLDELERVLVDVANSPDEVTAAQFESIRKRIEARGILLKVRVVRQELNQARETSSAPEHGDSSVKERNKT